MMEHCAAFDFSHVQAAQAVKTSSAASARRGQHFFPVLVSAAIAYPFPVRAGQSGAFLGQDQQRFFGVAALAPRQFPAVQFLPVHIILPFAFLINIRRKSRSASADRRNGTA